MQHFYLDYYNRLLSGFSAFMLGSPITYSPTIASLTQCVNIPRSCNYSAQTDKWLPMFIKVYAEIFTITPWPSPTIGPLLTLQLCWPYYCSKNKPSMCYLPYILLLPGLLLHQCHEVRIIISILQIRKLKPRDVICQVNGRERINNYARVIGLHVLTIFFFLLAFSTNSPLFLKKKNQKIC